MKKFPRSQPKLIQTQEISAYPFPSLARNLPVNLQPNVSATVQAHGSYHDVINLKAGDNSYERPSPAFPLHCNMSAQTEAGRRGLLRRGAIRDEKNTASCLVCSGSGELVAFSTRGAGRMPSDRKQCSGPTPGKESVRAGFDKRIDNGDKMADGAKHGKLAL